MHESGTGGMAGWVGRLGPANATAVRRRPGRRTALLIVVSGAALVVALVVTFLVTRPAAPRSIAIYDRGQATLVMNGLPFEALPLIDAGATLVSPGGATLAWQSPDGWYLNVNGPFSFALGAATPAPTVAPVGSDVSLAAPIDANGSIQLAGGDVRRWAGFDSRACVILYTEVTAARIAGTVHCQGLVWYDGSAVEHIQPLDLPPFDIDAKFEASGPGALPEPSAP